MSKGEETLTEKKTQLTAFERLENLKKKSKKAEDINYEEFEELAELVKEFLVKSKLLETVTDNIFSGFEALKKDKEGYFKIISFITNTSPEVLEILPMYQLYDHLIITQDFLKEVKVLGFFTLSNTILTNLIAG